MEEKEQEGTELIELNDTEAPAVPEWYENMNLEDTDAIIRSSLSSAARHVIAIGYYLKHIRDHELYLDAGYESVWEYASDRYGFSKSATSRYMTRNDKFSRDGNSPILDEKYKDFGKAQLQEMLSLDAEQLEQVTPDMTVQQIRDIKKPKEVPYYPIEGQMDLLTDFPEIEATSCFQNGNSSARDEPGAMPAIETTMELGELLGTEKPEPSEFVAASQQESMDMEPGIWEVAAENAAEAANPLQNRNADIEPEDEPEPEHLEPEAESADPEDYYDRHILERIIQNTEDTLEVMRDYWLQNQRGTYKEHRMMLEAYRMYLELDGGREEETR